MHLIKCLSSVNHVYVGHSQKRKLEFLFTVVEVDLSVVERSEMNAAITTESISLDTIA